MRRLLHAFIAMAVFSTASSGLCTLEPDLARPCATACATACAAPGSAPEDQSQSDDSAMHSCCCAMPVQESQQGLQPDASCASHSQKCATSPTAGLQFGLTQGEKSQTSEATPGTSPSEPKPWPPSFFSAWSVKADSADLLLVAFFGARQGLLADACKQGRSTLEHLSRLSVFRI